MTIKVPSLAERREDVSLLFLKLVNEAAARYRNDPTPVPPHLVTTLTEREWPGNVRELRNAADRFGLGLGLQFDDDRKHQMRPMRLADRVAAFEKSIIASELVMHRGSLKPVYETLGLSRKSLYEKMQKFGLDKQSFISSQED